MTESTQSPLKSDKLIVAAIDFGTTYSGYAFSFKHDFQKEPTKVCTNTAWVGGTSGLMSMKTPTVLLLKPDQTFEAFGYEAENRYCALVNEGDGIYKTYYYFRRFKMLLYNVTYLKRTLELEDEHGNKMTANRVFIISIQYLMQQLLETLNSRALNIVENDIQWVITVPAIWSDGSKQFMREAAQEAGIKTENLIIALEPEAASLFCMHLPVDKIISKTERTSGISPFAKGTKYMIVDAGGGTVDITIHEVLEDKKLKELSAATGGAWGGTMVDKAFSGFLSKLIGEKIYKEFTKDSTEDVIDLFREFEAKKRNISIDKTSQETIRIPHGLSKIYKNMTGKSLKKAIAEDKELQDKVKLTGDKIRVNADILKSWFDESCTSTVKHIQEQFETKAGAGVNTILLVGGFSESSMLQSHLKKAFKDKRIIIPEDPGLVVLKGAVIFGHNPIAIISRIAKCSYGIRVFRDYQEGIHPADKKTKFGGKVRCKDVFALHVRKGQELIVGQVQSAQRYIPLEEDQLTLDFDVYTSSEEEPSYITDKSCSYIGQLEVGVSDICVAKGQGVWVKMIFGGTEVTVEAKEETSGQISRVNFDFLQ